MKSSVNSFLIADNRSLSKEEVVEANRFVNKGNCKLHTWEDHNFYIRRYGRCVYCMLGSKPVPKAVISDMIQ